MTRPHSTTLARAAAVLLAFQGASLFAQGQPAAAPAPLQPPTMPPPKDDQSMTVQPAFWTAVVLALTIGAAFIPVKRGKQND